jgi:hypothetical protein
MYAISCMTVLYSGVVIKGILVLEEEGGAAGAVLAVEAEVAGFVPGFRKGGFLKDNVGCLVAVAFIFDFGFVVFTGCLKRLI